MTKVAVLGAGLVGFPMAVDLSKDKSLEVFLGDIDEVKLRKVKAKGDVKTAVLDVTSEKELKKFISDKDLVLSAVPGFLGYRTLKSVIESEKTRLISPFFPKILSLWMSWRVTTA